MSNGSALDTLDPIYAVPSLEYLAALLLLANHQNFINIVFGLFPLAQNYQEQFCAI